MDTSRLLTPGELSERSGVAVSALHFYEREGLIESRRTSGNQRRYSAGRVRRVAFIRTSQRVGVPLAEIRAALETLPAGRTPTKRDWTPPVAGAGAPTSTTGSPSCRSCATPSTSASAAAACR